MAQERVRIADIAEELGVSTATVSNVIHGKTKKISAETVKRVQALLEERDYIPSMAGILLAQNDSRMIGVIVNDHEKYGGEAMSDAFISSAVGALSTELEKAGYFLMLKITKAWEEIPRFGSMWNMDGMILMGFCEQDYQKLRDVMRIPFVVYDGYLEQPERLCNLTIDHYDGGRQMGDHFREKGHRRALCISDNDICMDKERFDGFRAGMEGEADLLLVPMDKKKRHTFYAERLELIQSYTAVFAVSDHYAADLIFFLQKAGLRVPEDISVAGFDDTPLASAIYPALTTIRQDNRKRAETALGLLQEMKTDRELGKAVTLPVMLVARESIKDLTK